MTYKMFMIIPLENLRINTIHMKALPGMPPERLCARFPAEGQVYIRESGRSSLVCATCTLPQNTEIGLPAKTPEMSDLWLCLLMSHTVTLIL